LDDPVLMGRKVFFFVGSDGYEFPADGFGMRGRVVDVRTLPWIWLIRAFSRTARVSDRHKGKRAE